MNTDSFSTGGYDNTFSVQWENTICLICKTKLAVLKEYNLKRHYSTEHGEQYEKYKGDEGKKMRTTWRTTVSIRSFPQSEGRCCCRWNELCGKGIYRKSRKVIPRRTVSQGSHVASRLHLCPEKKSWFNKISSLANTAAERINELSGDMCEQLLEQQPKFHCHLCGTWWKWRPDRLFPASHFHQQLLAPLSGPVCHGADW